MRLFCPDCGKQLLIEHSIKVDLVSNFTFCDGTITLTKHQIRNSENIRQKLTLEKTNGMFCSSCAKNYSDIEGTLCKCDECGNKLTVKDVQKIGETIILCHNCMSKYRHFKDFKIFGLRGPDKKTRKKRFEEVIEEVTAVRDFPEEIQQIYDAATAGEDSDSPFDGREDEIIEELIQLEESMTTPPQEQSSPQVTPDRFRGVGVGNVDVNFNTSPGGEWFTTNSGGTSLTDGG